jgi:hypothetical protein
MSAADPTYEMEPHAGELALPGFRSYVRTARWPLLAMVAALFGMYLPAVTTRYAFSDDYALLWMAVSGRPNAWFGKSVIDIAAAGGRPVEGVLLQAALSTAGDIDNLRFVRLVAVIGIVALATLLHRALVREGIGQIPAALIAVFICSMPAFVVVASWATLFDAPIAAMLSGGASLLVTSSLDLPRKARLERLAAATSMFVGGFLIYQPAAMFFWVFLAIALIGRAHTPNLLGRLVRIQAAVGLVGILAGFVIGKAAAHLAHSTAPSGDRATLTHHPIGKASWFLAHPLYRSLSLFEVRNTPWLAMLAVVFAGAGIWLFFGRGAQRPGAGMITAAALVPLAFLPNLVVAENDTFVFRTSIAMTSVVALYVGLGVLGSAQLVGRHLARRTSASAARYRAWAGLGAAVVLVATAGAAASRHMSNLVTGPQSKELDLVRADVAQLPTGIRRVGFVQLTWQQGIVPWYSDEIGIPSSAKPWTPQPELLLILREEGRLDLAAPPIVDTLQTDRGRGGEPVIDVAPQLEALRR